MHHPKTYMHQGGGSSATTGVNHNKHYGDPIYKQNGTGRDSYIHLNNGGFSIQGGPTRSVSSGKFLPNISNMKTTVTPYQSNVIHKAKPTHWVSDGTGRDSYIFQGDGGFHNATLPTKIGVKPSIIF
jgi:hypothetical protein